MTDSGRRLTERILEPTYVQAVRERNLTELRAMREECMEGETELSFERKLCQGRIDILNAELERRDGGQTEIDLVARLPQILADPGASTGPSDGLPLPERAPNLSVPRSADAPHRRVEELIAEKTLMRLPEVSSDEIKAIIQSLAQHEQSLSSRRKGLHEVLDVVQAEIVRRYTSGEADPTLAL
ncbi:MAG: ABC transporter substrate-binding protein [Actinobacteria bacterium]|jgi:hypothetical protein|nr:ABC transporter substrate-binding protein [Actinomycetota bacterium]